MAALRDAFPFLLSSPAPLGLISRGQLGGAGLDICDQDLGVLPCVALNWVRG